MGFGSLCFLVYPVPHRYSPIQSSIQIMSTKCGCYDFHGGWLGGFAHLSCWFPILLLWFDLSFILYRSYFGCGRALIWLC